MIATVVRRREQNMGQREPGSERSLHGVLFESLP